MFIFILSIFAGGVAAGALLYAIRFRGRDGTSIFTGIAITAGLIGLALFLTSISTIVPTKHVGIPVTFGSPGAPMSNGFHVKAPWTKVVKMDGTVQDTDNAGDNPTLAKDADDADVRVHNLVRWKIQTAAADTLYADYRDFDRIANSLVQPEINTAIASVMATYAPLEADQPTNDELARLIADRLQDRVGDRIQIESVSLSLIDFSEATTARINALNSERANTRIAEQRKETAAKEAETNSVLAESLRDPNVIVSNCLKEVSEAPQTFPAGFQCWPGTGGGALVSNR